MRAFAFAHAFLPLAFPFGIAAFFASPLPALAQPGATSYNTPNPARLTLATAIERALSHHPDIAAAQRELEASEGALIQGRARPNPELAYQLEDTRRATRSSTLQLSQLIETGGKRAARIELGERTREAAAKELDARRAEIQAQATGAFFELLTAQERVRLSQDTAALAHRATEAAAKRVAAGKVAPLEENKARVAESGARLELAQAQAELQMARLRLGALWGEPATSLEAVDGAVDPLPAAPDPSQLDQRLAQAPTLQRAQIEVQRRRALADLERAKRLPDPTVSLGLKRSEELGRNQLLLGFSMPIPVFDRNTGNQLQALKSYEKAQEELAATQLRLHSEALQARERVALHRLEAQTLKDEVLPGAQAAYDAASKGFDLGKFGFLDVLDAQRTLFQARAQLLRATAEAHRAAADIDRLLGPLPRP